LDSGGHRRLSGLTEEPAPRPLVPLPVRLPQLLEPDHLACSPAAEGLVAVLTTGGAGALVPAGVAGGRDVGEAVAFTLLGLLELGMARSVTWGQSGLLVVTGSGQLANCPTAGLAAGTSHCEQIRGPPLPDRPASVFDFGSTLRAAVAGSSGRVALMELLQDGMDLAWQEVGAVHLPQEAPDVMDIKVSQGHLLVSVNSGAAYRWSLRDGLPISAQPVHDVPVRGQQTWQSACVLPNSKIVRLASTWQRDTSTAQVLRPELFL